MGFSSCCFSARADGRSAGGGQCRDTRGFYRRAVEVKATDGANPRKLYTPQGQDFSMRSHSPAIDTGIELPTVTDGFTEKAPDLRAYDFSSTPPCYGPERCPASAAPSKLQSQSGPSH